MPKRVKYYNCDCINCGNDLLPIIHEVGIDKMVDSGLWCEQCETSNNLTYERDYNRDDNTVIEKWILVGDDELNQDDQDQEVKVNYHP